jgi:hypothetical protein
MDLAETAKKAGSFREANRALKSAMSLALALQGLDDEFEVDQCFSIHDPIDGLEDFEQ